MKMKHVGNLNCEYDFIQDKCLKTVSIKTIMSGNKICPQSIGQCSLKRFNDKMSLGISNKMEFKSFFLENKTTMLEKYLENTFCCDKTIIFKFQAGIIYIIEKTGNVCFNNNILSKFSTSKNLNNWNESSTVYVESGGSRGKVQVPKKSTCSLGEIQIHNNRDCIKFRFNINTLVDMINRGDILNLNVRIHNLNNRYNFTIDNMVKGEFCFKSFNYIGSKMKLLDFIEETIKDYTGKGLKDIDSFADIFSGTGVVAYHILKRGCKKILTNDIQHYAYTVSSVWTTRDIDVNKVKRLLSEINSKNDMLTENNIVPDKQDFIYNNYTEGGDDKRMYLTKMNGYKVDKTRQSLNEMLKNKDINEREFNLMLKILLYGITKVSNIASVYGAYLKNYKSCALKPLVLDISLIDSMVEENQHQGDKSIDHYSFNKNVIDLLEDNCLRDYEVVYIDPPYVANRSYHDNYHLLETISKYDYPKIKGKTGLRDETVTKSKFCSKRDALGEFKLILDKIESKYIFISYSSESIVSKEQMIKILEESWDNVKCYEKDYQRFKSNKNSNDKQPKNVVEYLFCGERK
jgi:adenine-specific DNA-methyltransferase